MQQCRIWIKQIKRKVKKLYSLLEMGFDPYNWAIGFSISRDNQFNIALFFGPLFTIQHIKREK